MGSPGTAALITNIGQGTTSLIGGLSQSSAIREKARFEKLAIDSQIQVERFRAEDAVRRGHQAVSEHNQRVKQLIGRQRTGFAGQNVLVGSGSAARVAAETNALGALDAITIARNARREALDIQLGIGKLRTQRGLVGAAADVESRATALTGGLQFVRSLGRGIKEREQFELELEG